MTPEQEFVAQGRCVCCELDEREACNMPCANRRGNRMSGWDSYFMTMAAHVASRSKDRSTKVGCVIVGPDNEVRSTGYNSFPRGINDNAPERHERPEKYLWTEHAERNAIYNAARVGTPLKGCRAYLPWFPCMDCARALVQAGIVELVATKPDLNDPRWGEDFKRVGTLFEEAGATIRFVCEAA